MAPSSLQSVFGSGLVGIVLAATLFGVYSSQVYSYFNKYSNDRWWTKLLVVAIWVSISIEYSLSLHAIYRYLIDDFGVNSDLAVANWDWLSYVLLTSVTSVMVQFFFARRLFHLLHNRIAKWVALVVISTLSLTGFIFGVFMTAKTIEMRLFASFTQVTWGIDIWLGANVMCDLCITLSMCYALHTSRTGIKSTDRLINKLMAYSIQTGAVTSFTEIFCLATYTASGFHFGHVLVVFPLSGLYATSFLANLHARNPNSPGYSSSRGVVVTGSDMEMSTNRSFGSSQRTRIQNSQFVNGKPLTMKLNGPNDTIMDDTLPDEDYLVKAPAPHSTYDAGSVV
jgi:hypothetical protein